VFLQRFDSVFLPISLGTDVLKTSVMKKGCEQAGFRSMRGQNAGNKKEKAELWICAGEYV